MLRSSDSLSAATAAKFTAKFTPPGTLTMKFQMRSGPCPVHESTALHLVFALATAGVSVTKSPLLAVSVVPQPPCSTQPQHADKSSF